MLWSRELRLAVCGWAQLKQEAERARAQFGQFDNSKDAAARAQEAARQREAQAAQLAQCVLFVVVTMWLILFVVKHACLRHGCVCGHCSFVRMLPVLPKNSSAKCAM